MGLSSVVFILFFVIQIGMMVPFSLAVRTQNSGINPLALSETLSSNGLFLTIAIIASGPVCTALVVLFARLRKSFPIKDYLSLKKTTKKEWIRWLISVGVFIVASDALTSVLRRPIVPPFLMEAYRTASSVPLLYIAFVVIAPIFEEIFFRGFLFQGLKHSLFGPAGAIGLTSLAWSIIHLQYDFYGIATVFAGGLLLGMARHKSDSIYVTIAMHSLMNLVATTEASAYVNYFS
jgi:membrane protease YdiL (CAAX protease family)